jgi:RNA polymerase sigma factor (TIGR02999 family)
MPAPPGEVTKLLCEMREGSRDAESRLAVLVQGELRGIAARLLRFERPDHTLQATALVNEAYLRLLGGSTQEWQSRAHFFAVAAQVMRRILVDSARAYRAGKRSGKLKRLDLSDIDQGVRNDVEQVLAVDTALTKLAAWDPRQCRIVELRFFAGLSEGEIAEVLQVSSRTVRRDWNVARAWLKGELMSVADSAEHGG